MQKTLELDTDQARKLLGDQMRLYRSETGETLPGRTLSMLPIANTELAKLYPGTLQINPAHTENFLQVIPNVLLLDKSGDAFIPGLEIGGVPLPTKLYFSLGLPYGCDDVGVATGCWETMHHNNKDYLGFRYTWPDNSSHLLLILNCFAESRHSDVLRRLPSFVSEYKATFVGYLRMTSYRTSFYLIIPNDSLDFVTAIDTIQNCYAMKAQS